MEVFTLIVDEKVSVWRRSRVTVKAESIEKAAKDCIRGYNELNIVNSEYITETESCLDKDFNNPVTIEVMDNDYNTLATNERNR